PGIVERNDILHGNFGRGVLLGKHEAADENRLVFDDERGQALVTRGKDHGLERAGAILDTHGGPGFAILVALARDSGEDSAELHFGVLLETFETAAVVSAKLRNLIGITVDRMSGDPEAEEFLFAGELILL